MKAAKHTRNVQREYLRNLNAAQQPLAKRITESLKKVTQSLNEFAEAVCEEVSQNVMSSINDTIHDIIAKEVASVLPATLNRDLEQLKKKVADITTDRASETYSKAFAFHEFAKELDAQHDNDEIISLDISCDEYFHDADGNMDREDVKRIIDAGIYQFPNEYEKIQKEFDEASEFQKIRQIKRWCRNELLQLETKAPPNKLTKLFPAPKSNEDSEVEETKGEGYL